MVKRYQIEDFNCPVFILGRRSLPRPTKLRLCLLPSNDLLLQQYDLRKIYDIFATKIVPQCTLQGSSEKTARELGALS